MPAPCATASPPGGAAARANEHDRDDEEPQRTHLGERHLGAGEGEEDHEHGCGRALHRVPKDLAFTFPRHVLHDEAGGQEGEQGFHVHELGDLRPEERDDDREQEQLPVDESEIQRDRATENDPDEHRAADLPGDSCNGHRGGVGARRRREVATERQHAAEEQDDDDV